MSGQMSVQFLILRKGNYFLRRMKQKFGQRIEDANGDGNIIRLLFSLKGLEILH
jgi:hypothetical protein